MLISLPATSCQLWKCFRKVELKYKLVDRAGLTDNQHNTYLTADIECCLLIHSWTPDNYIVFDRRLFCHQHRRAEITNCCPRIVSHEIVVMTL
jgi:hypothetical protein